jgi:peptidyl-tRNA hydrolase, PTH1 family
MFLIVGLGNPGKKYQKTRHNIGFRVIEQLKEENNFSDFSFSKKDKALISEGIIAQKKILLVLPQTLMNNSGFSLKKIINYTRLTTKDLIVVHDDLDLNLGRIKISKNRGAAGHKGVLSIINSLGSQQFGRLRIGINPKNLDKKKDGGAREIFVLSDFKKDEEDLVKKTIPQACQAIRLIIEQGLSVAMNQVNH